jgi:hypothetical protein
VLTALYLEIADVPRLAEQTSQAPRGAEHARSQTQLIRSMESESDDPLSH